MECAKSGKPLEVHSDGKQSRDFTYIENVVQANLLAASKPNVAGEFFNIANHPTFNAPNFGGNGVVAIGGSGNYTSSTFGEIGSTRTNPYDARQIQFALKFYF